MHIRNKQVDSTAAVQMKEKVIHLAFSHCLQMEGRPYNYGNAYPNGSQCGDLSSDKNAAIDFCARMHRPLPQHKDVVRFF